MKISGVLVLRNGTALGYPFELAIRSLRPLCEEVVVSVDPTSEDDTVDRVWMLRDEGVVDRIFDSVWDMTNHQGHTNCEISVQTEKVCAVANGDWIFSLQADEVLHEAEIEEIRQAVQAAELRHVTGIELRRLYFYGGLGSIREDWTLWLLRLFKRGFWRPGADGAMSFDAVRSGEHTSRVNACIYHYSRVGDPQQIAERVRNLDGFFHAPDKILKDDLTPYDFSALRKLDTYVKGHVAEIAENARLVPFSLDKHPASALNYFHAKR